MGRGMGRGTGRGMGRSTVMYKLGYLLLPPIAVGTIGGCALNRNTARLSIEDCYRFSFFSHKAVQFTSSINPLSHTLDSRNAHP